MPDFLQHHDENNPKHVDGYGQSFSRREFVVSATAAVLGVAAFGLGVLPGCSHSQVESGPFGGSSGSNSGTNSGELASQPIIMATVSTPCSNLDPVGNPNPLAVGAGWHVYEGLYELNPHDFTNYRALAKGDLIEESPTQFTLELREDARYSDGTPVKTQDVVEAFEQNMESTWYGTLLSFVQRVTAMDSSHVRFTLLYPCRWLLERRLSLVKITPITSATKELPLGSGPWALENNNGEENSRLLFMPNEYYNGPFYSTSIEPMSWSVKPDEDDRLELLSRNRALVAESVSSDQTFTRANPQVTFESLPSMDAALLVFNTAKPPFNQAKSRQALFYAIDCDRLIATALHSQATAATCLVPDFFPNYHRTELVYSFDRARAKNLLIAENRDTPPTFRLLVDDGWVSALAPYLVEDFEACGWQVTSEVVPLRERWEEFSADAFEQAKTSDTALDFDVILTSDDPSIFGNDADLILQWFYGDSPWVRGRSCWANTTDWRRLQGLLERARRANSDGERQNLWNECFDLVAREVPLYPLLHRHVSTGYYPAQLNDYSPISPTALWFLGTTTRNEP